MPKLGGRSFPEWASGNERLTLPDWSFRDAEGLLESVATNQDRSFCCSGDDFREEGQGKTGGSQGSTCSI